MTNFNEQSLEAYDSLADYLPQQRAQVLAGFRSFCGEGATREEVSARIGVKHQSCTARAVDLVRDGYLLETQRLKKTASNRNARVLVARDQWRGEEQDPLYTVATTEPVTSNGIAVADDVDDPRYHLKRRLFLQALGILILDAAPMAA